MDSLTTSSKIKKAIPNSTDVQLLSSKNSIVAKNGIRAETKICSQPNIKQWLDLHFKLPIKSITKISKKKFDIEIEFENGTKTTIQNKDGDGKGRGWSVDRRNIQGFEDKDIKTLLNTLCLKKGTEKPIIGKNISKNVIDKCMLGATEEEYPKYFTHTISDKSTGNIIKMSICPTSELMQVLHNELYTTIKPKRTCVHLSPNCYLQRKGGGKTDSNPDHIQMKFKLTDPVDILFKNIFM